jgi:histone deacetylase 6
MSGAVSSTAEPADPSDREAADAADSGNLSPALQATPPVASTVPSVADDRSAEEPAAAESDSTSSAAAVARAKGVREWLEASDLLGSCVEDGAACGVGLVYDEAMLQHCGPPSHPEQPARLKEILAQLRLSGLLQACVQLPSREAIAEELCLCHDTIHVDRVLHYEASARRKPKAYSFPFGPDTYVCEQTPRCAVLAAGSPLNLVDAAFDDKSPIGCGMAIVRPPGHHANADRASGFCLFNNVAVAARYAQHRHQVKRVAIIDWDVHHGNGTNDLFEEDPDVLFFSMHRCGLGFFPGTGFHEDSGKHDGKGYTVNVPLDKGFGDIDVTHVMRYVICPLLEKFRPEAIFISAGFDAVKGDPLGECKLSPTCYGWMTRCLYRLAKHYCDGRLFLLLEGGYNPDLIAQCTVECVQALVLESTGLSVGSPELPEAAPSCTATPATSAAVTPAMSPALSASLPAGLSLPSPALSAASPPMSPRSGKSTPTSTPGSPAAKPQKVRIPANKTVAAVRKLTELHHMLALELPLAPKQLDKSGQDKAEKKCTEERETSQP